MGSAKSGSYHGLLLLGQKLAVAIIVSHHVSTLLTIKLGS